MKLTINLRNVIIRQFKTGDTIAYLATLYGVRQDRIEQLIREVVIDLMDKPLNAEAEKRLEN